MDKFKCVKCGKIFDEFEADYNFMSREGKELCPECIKREADFKKFEESFRKEHSLKCPFCGEDYTTDSEFKEDLITYHAEDGIIKKECQQCEKEFYVEEIIDRTWNVAKTKEEIEYN